MTAEERRRAVVKKYAEIIGRNYYSQAKRDYCFKKYSDGKYYSDCSSSVSYSYRESGNSFGIMNTAGMYNAVGSKFTKVPVVIENGQIMNPDVLRVGDMLLYAGTDNSRPGCVGHVEMYIGVENGKHYLYGHGSGNPKKTEMTSKNKSRYNSKTGTKVGNKGLIRVVRFIQDDAIEDDAPEIGEVLDGLKVKPGTWNIRSEPDVSSPVIALVAGGTVVEPVSSDGWHFIRSGNLCGWVSDKALEV